jgi:hypothetical protein
MPLCLDECIRVVVRCSRADQWTGRKHRKREHYHFGLVRGIASANELYGPI